MVLHVISYQFMKANITLKLDTDVLREARILAAEEGLSVSGLLAAKLDEIVRQRKGYDRSRKRAVARLHKGFELGWAAPRSRDELHERSIVRRHKHASVRPRSRRRRRAT